MDAKPNGCLWHQLHDSCRAFARYCVGIPIRLFIDDGFHELKRYSICSRVILNPSHRPLVQLPHVYGLRAGWSNQKYEENCQFHAATSEACRMDLVSDSSSR